MFPTSTVGWAILGESILANGWICTESGVTLRFIECV